MELTNDDSIVYVKYNEKTKSYDRVRDIEYYCDKNKWRINRNTYIVFDDQSYKSIIAPMCRCLLHLFAGLNIFVFTIYMIYVIAEYVMLFMCLIYGYECVKS